MSFLQIPIGTYPNTFLGYQSSIGITTGTGDTAFGYLTLNANTTGSDNSAFGSEALRFNVSGSRNTAGGANALLINNANNNTAFGYASQRGNVNGQDNSSFGHDSMRVGDDGNENSAFGSGALYNAANTQGNSGFGYLSLYNVTSGLKNSAFGWASGSLITTGSKNSILGSYSGNQGGLDIRTLSNYIVLSDGDGNPRLWIDNTGAVNIPGGTVFPGGVANGVLYLNAVNAVTSGTALNFNGTRLQLLADNPLLLLSDTDLTIRRAAIQLDTGGGTWSIENNNNLVLKNAVPGAAITTGSFIDLGRNVDPLIFGTSGLERMRIDASGNLGLGVVPQAWSTRALEIAGGVGLSSVSGADITLNAYYNAGWLYRSTGNATRYEQLTGQHRWYTAPSGTAGNPISFTQAMTLDALGNLGIGTTSPFSRLDSASARSTSLNSISAFNTMPLTVTDTTPFAVGVGGGINFRAQLSSTAYSTYAAIWSFRESATISDYRGSLIFGTSDNTDGYPEERARIDSGGNVVIGTAALATNATNGFFYVAGCAGTPTGVPTAFTGRVPIVVDTTNNKLYFYSNGAWRDAGP